MPDDVLPELPDELLLSVEVLPELPDELLLSVDVLVLPVSELVDDVVFSESVSFEVLDEEPQPANITAMATATIVAPILLKLPMRNSLRVIAFHLEVSIWPYVHNLLYNILS